MNNMLKRVASIPDLLGVRGQMKDVMPLVLKTSSRTGMMHLNDYEALAAILIKYKPKHIFEIGTYKGITSDFFLEFSSEVKVISISCTDPLYNTTRLPLSRIGSEVAPERRGRFTQIIGDSHSLQIDDFLNKYDFCDMVFIDGDHSFSGVKKDTEFAKKIVHGILCWHDVNPCEQTKSVKRYLDGLTDEIFSTNDDYVGGIGFSVNL